MPCFLVRSSACWACCSGNAAHALHLGALRWHDYEELVARDKTSPGIFLLKDESLADSDNLPAPGVIAREIVEDLEAALAQFRLIAGDLGEVVDE